MPAGVGSLLGMLLAVVAILALAWWVTSLIARQGTLALPGLAVAGSASDFCVLRQIPISRTERLLLLTEEESQTWLENQPGAPGTAGVDFRRFLHMSTKK